MMAEAGGGDADHFRIDDHDHDDHHDHDEHHDHRDHHDRHDHGHGHGHEENGSPPVHKDRDDRHSAHGGHEHEQAHRDDVQRRLKLAASLCFIFLACEIAGGLISGSLAILSDAAHLFSDFMGFVFAVAAGHMAGLRGSASYTFGYRRWEVVAALFSMSSLAVCSILLEVEGIRRFLPYVHPDFEVIKEVDGEVMSIIAFIGVVINVSLALILGVENHVHMPGDDHGHSHDHSHDEEHDHGHGHGHSSIEMGSLDRHDHHDHHEHGHAHHRPHEHAHSHDAGDPAKKADDPLENASHDDHDHSHGHRDDHDHSSRDHDSHDDHDHSSHDHDRHDDHSRSSHDDHSHDHHTVDLEGSKSHDDSSHGILEEQSLVSEERPRKKKENINLRAAYLHVLADLVQSVAVLIAGLVIVWKPEWSVIDPVLTIIFCPLIFYSTIGVIRTSMRVLLEGAPTGVNVDELWSSISAVEEVEDVTSVNVWSITHGAVAATVHARSASPQLAMRRIHGICTGEYGIDHCTIQVEDERSGSFLDDPSACSFYAPVNRGYELVGA